MSSKYSFRLHSEDKRRPFPAKIIIGRNDTETSAHALLKFLAYVLFFRERLQLELRLPDDDIPFVPDLIQLDYELRPVLWVECGECSVTKLDKLAVKVPDAEIWVVKPSALDIEQLWMAMNRAGLRRNRYHLLGFDPEMFEEIRGLLQTRNEVFWVRGSFDPPNLQFDFNGLWFDAAFAVLRF